MSTEPGEAWFRDWFGEEYLGLYPHRDEEEAERAVKLFLETCDVRRGERVLDLACGAGRHLAELRAAGLAATGLDLSSPLLRRAASVAGGGVVRGDMRILPFGTGSFGAVAQFFTSFGYFETRSEDRRVLEEVRRVLGEGGVYLLDFLNARKVREELVPEDSRRVGGRTVRQQRRIEDGAVVKRIVIEDREAGDPPTVYHERVRLYEPDELATMLATAGLPPRSRFGDYDGAAFRPERSPRLLLVGEAT